MTPAESSSTGGPRSVGEIMAQLAALGVHHEELQVVSEELRVQQEQVLGRHEVEARWRSQLEANPALATTVEVGLSRLRGKPLSVFLSPADTLPFREVTLRPRSGRSRPAELFGFTEWAGEPAVARVQWVVAPAPYDAGTGMAAPVRSVVAGADWVSITLGSPREPQRLGSDSPEAQDFDGRQLRVQEGPCWEAYRTGTVVASADVGTDERWPRLRELAPDGAVRAVLAVPVQEDGGTTGVITIYSGRAEAFGTANRRSGELAAAAVAGVLQNVAQREALAAMAHDLEKALTSRAVIDQAKGVLMARLGVDAEEALARLVTLSSRLNVKVRDLARLLVEGDTDLVLAAGH